MYFGLSEEQKSLEENISKFLSDNAPLDTIKAVANGEEVKADEIHKGIIELGLSGIMVPRILWWIRTKHVVCNCRFFSVRFWNSARPIRRSICYGAISDLLSW